MKISLNSKVLDLLMPECRRLDTPPQVLVELIILEYFNSTKRVKIDGISDRK